MRLSRLLLSAASLIALAAAVPAAHADNIAWTHWTSVTSGSPGSGSGSISTVKYGSVGVTYSGQTSGMLTNYPSWGPASTFSGGIVGNAPPASFNSVQLEGGVSYTETVTFSQTLADPIFAVWSLGAPGTPATFDFTAGENFNVLDGGRSNEYGGTPLIISSGAVSGQEGTASSSSSAITTPSASRRHSSRATTPSPSARTTRSPRRSAARALRRSLRRSCCWRPG
jgi:hypothetical protein